MIKKNFIAHTESNKLTSVIFSLTLGSIVFTMVTAQLNIALFTTNTEYGQINYQMYLEDYHSFHP